MKKFSLGNILKKQEIFTIKEYFEIVKPKYVIMKITPVTSNRNYNSELIAKTIANMYKPINQRIKKEKHFHLTYNLPEKVSFIIDISLKEVSFYVVCAEYHEKLISEKISETWNRVHIKKVSTIPNFSEESLKYQLMYQKLDSLSLKVDKRTNDPLNGILNVLEILEEDDRVAVMYNFMPTIQEGWRLDHRQDLEKIKKGLPMDKKVLSWQFVLKNGVMLLVNFMDYVCELVGSFLSNDTKSKLALNEAALGLITSESFKNLSDLSKSKGDNTVIDTQILVLSDSKNEQRRESNAISVCEAYKSISKDNSLIYKRLKNSKNTFYVSDFSIAGVTKNKVSTLECKNFLQIPGRDLLETHKNISMVDVLENPIPEELRKGYIYLGESPYRSKFYSAYLSDTYKIGNLPLLILGPQGAGKSTFLSNLVSRANLRKECVILIDYIKNCELSADITSVIPKEDLIIIDLSKYEDLQGLGYNEIKIKNVTSEFEIMEKSNLKAEQTMALIDSINEDGKPLSSKMRRFLSAAANIVYMHEGKSIGDVIKCLQHHKKRHEYIDYVKNTLSEDGISYFDDFIDTLEELDEINVSVDKQTKEVTNKEIVGTKDTKIEGILDRIELLKENIRLKFMFTKSCEHNIDFVECMEKGKIVLIKMPEDKFNSSVVKNVITTFFTSKIILATKLRGALHKEPKRCHIIYDEISQAPTSEVVLRKVLSQLRKFGTKIIISAHYLNQLIYEFKNELMASGCSYMLLQGCDKKNFEELKEYLDPFQLQDLINLKQYQSLNLILYEKGHGKFVTNLPGPLNKMREIKESNGDIN